MNSSIITNGGFEILINLYCSVIPRTALAVISLALAPMTMSAGVIYDNLSVGSGAVSGGVAGVAPAPAAHGPLGDSFSTGGSAVNLTDVKLLLSASNPSDGGFFAILLLSNNANSPGATLDTLSVLPDNFLTTTLSALEIALFPPSPIALAANTRYWIEVTSNDQGSAQWSFDATNVGTGVASEYNYFNGSALANSAFTPYQMEITVAPASSAVPEPATWTLLAAGLALIPAIRRKFRA